MTKTALTILSMLIFTAGAFSQAENLVSSRKTAKEQEIVTVNIAEVVSAPKQYDGVQVSLEGEVKKVKYTRSSKGEDFTVFELKDDEGNKIGVYYEDEHLPIEVGDTVRITGKFRKEKKYFLYKVKNVIKARTVKKLGSDI